MNVYIIYNIYNMCMYICVLFSITDVLQVVGLNTDSSTFFFAKILVPPEEKNTEIPSDSRCNDP